MKTIFPVLLASIVLLGMPALSGALGAERNRLSGPLAVSTFHCIGLYWSPPGGAAGKEVWVRYRQADKADWRDALPMRYNPIPIRRPRPACSNWLPTARAPVRANRFLISAPATRAAVPTWTPISEARP
jgi:hypothetical protein